MRTWIGFGVCFPFILSLFFSKQLLMRTQYTHTRNKPESCSNSGVDRLQLCLLPLSLSSPNNLCELTTTHTHGGELFEFRRGMAMVVHLSRPSLIF
jgi:hypothetical protein